MPGVFGINRRAIDMYFEVGPGDPNVRLGEGMARDIGLAFDVSPELFINLEKAWLKGR